MSLYSFAYRKASRSAFARAAANSNFRDHTPKNGAPRIGETATEAGTDPVVAVPSNFDPHRHPILAVHWFGQPESRTAPVVDLDLIHLTVALHRLGETIGADVGNRADMFKRIDGGRR